MSFHRRGTLVLSVVIAALGLALVGRGIAAGAPFAVGIGLLFVVAGAGRAYLLRRR